MAEEFVVLLPLWIIVIGAIGVLIIEAVWGTKGRSVLFAATMAILLLAFIGEIMVYRWTCAGAQDIFLFNRVLKISALTNLFVLSAIVAAILTILFSDHYLIAHAATTGEYYFLVLMVVAGMINVILSHELVTFLVGLELLSLGSYALAGYFRNREKSIEAALKYYLPGIFSTAIMVMGIAFIFGATGTTFFDQLNQGMLQMPHRSIAFVFGFIMLLAGIAFKLTLVPFHAYAPDVYEGASAPISGLLSTGIKIAVFASLVRILGDAFQLPSGKAMFVFLSTATMAVGNSMALKQENIKRMLAYSSIAHAGYMVIALVSHSAIPARDMHFAIGFYLLAYTFMTLGSFGILGWLSGREERFIYLKDLAGISKRCPAISLALAVLMFSLAGFPPTAGFFAKYYVFRLAIVSGDLWLAIFGILNSFISAYYYLRVVVYIMMKNDNDVQLPALRLSLKLAILLSILGTFAIPFISFP